MIVGTNFVTFQKTTVERPVQASTPVDQQVQDAASDALAKLDNFVESAALSRKAFAEDRLQHIKEQMNTLAMFNLAPGFLAGHTARMAKELESAATDFASSFKTLGEQEQTKTAGSSLPQAYLDVLRDDTLVSVRMNTEDAATAASFITTAQSLRDVVDIASEGAAGKFNASWIAEGARDATSRVVSIMSRLEGPSMFNKIFW